MLSNKECHLIVHLQKRNYLQINVFLASRDTVERNFKVLLIKAIKNFLSRAREEILIFINKNLNTIFNVIVKRLVAQMQLA